MDIRIDINGHLFLRRGEVPWKQQFCPFHHNWGCGDWCPLFEEPKNIPVPNQGYDWKLVLCKTAHLTNNLIDERISKETNG